MERGEGFPPPFLYGTHYSNVGAVLHYLVRLEPFSTIGIDLGGGRLDRSDRLFHSIEDTWRNNLSNDSDVKELIPEFFCLPDFLVNRNGIPLGELQNGKVLGDVTLPRWASSPHDFIIKHRRALESDYVSAHLHHWIDLIFGYKQRGEEAVKANNLFFHLTYEDSVDVSKISDPMERRSIETQIESFGQTPSQLFGSSHPARRGLPSQRITKGHLLPAMFDTLPSDHPRSIAFSVHSAFKVPHSVGHVMTFATGAQSSRSVTEDSLGKLTIVTFHATQATLTALSHSVTWGEDVPKPAGVTDSTVWDEGEVERVSDNNIPLSTANVSHIIYRHTCRQLTLASSDESSLRQSIASSAGSQTVVIGGFTTMSVLWWSGKQQVTAIHPWSTLVTCVSRDVAADNWFACGTASGVITVWEAVNNLASAELRFSLFGHDEDVSSIALDSKTDLCISLSKSSCLIHSVSVQRVLRRLSFCLDPIPALIDQTISPESSSQHPMFETFSRFRQVHVGSDGLFFVACFGEYVFVVGVDGSVLSALYIEGMTASILPPSSGVVFVAGRSCVHALSLPSLAECGTALLPKSSPVRCLSWTSPYLTCCHEDGFVAVLTVTASVFRDV